MLYIAALVIVLAILGMLLGQLNRQASVRTPRRGTNHLGRIRREARRRRDEAALEDEARNRRRT